MRLGLLTGFALMAVALYLSLIDPNAAWAALGIIGGELLRLKVFYFTVFSFALLPFGTLGLFWFFEYADRKTRMRGLALASILPIAFCILIYGLFF